MEIKPALVRWVKYKDQWYLRIKPYEWYCVYHNAFERVFSDSTLEEIYQDKFNEDD